MLTKTNPIVILNNAGKQSDYRKHSKTTQAVITSRVHGREQRGRPVNRPRRTTYPQPEIQHAFHGTPEKTSSDHERTTEHNNKKDSNGYPLDDSPPITEGGCTIVETQ